MIFAEMLQPLEVQFARLPAEKQESFNKMLDLSDEEWILFQNKKSLAHAEGRMDIDNANWVYQMLGTSAESFNKRPLPVKYLMTEIFKQLIKPGG